MSLETWGAFAIAAMILLVIPGPTIISVISHAAVNGRRAVIPLVIGVAVGDFTAMTLSILGLGAVLAASPMLFSVLKWLGIAYLLYLGIKIWRSNPEIAKTSTTAAGASKRSLGTSTFTVTALNPKSIGFFVAFLPQFVDPQGQAVPQFLLLGATFLVLGSINATLYAFFAGNLRETIQNSRARRWLNRCGGSALMGAGVFAAVMQRSS